MSGAKTSGVKAPAPPRGKKSNVAKPQQQVEKQQERTQEQEQKRNEDTTEEATRPVPPMALRSQSKQEPQQQQEEEAVTAAAAPQRPRIAAKEAPKRSPGMPRLTSNVPRNIHAPPSKQLPAKAKNTKNKKEKEEDGKRGQETAPDAPAAASKKKSSSSPNTVARKETAAAPASAAAPPASKAVAAAAKKEKDQQQAPAQQGPKKTAPNDQLDDTPSKQHRPVSPSKGAPKKDGGKHIPVPQKEQQKAKSSTIIMDVPDAEQRQGNDKKTAAAAAPSKQDTNDDDDALGPVISITFDVPPTPDREKKEEGTPLTNKMAEAGASSKKSNKSPKGSPLTQPHEQFHTVPLKSRLDAEQHLLQKLDRKQSYQRRTSRAFAPTKHNQKPSLWLKHQLEQKQKESALKAIEEHVSLLETEEGDVRTAITIDEETDFNEILAQFNRELNFMFNIYTPRSKNVEPSSSSSGVCSFDPPMGRVLVEDGSGGATSSLRKRGGGGGGGGKHNRWSTSPDSPNTAYTQRPADDGTVVTRLNTFGGTVLYGSHKAIQDERERRLQLLTMLRLKQSDTEKRLEKLDQDIAADLRVQKQEEQEEEEHAQSGSKARGDGDDLDDEATAIHSSGSDKGRGPPTESSRIHASPPKQQRRQQQQRGRRQVHDEVNPILPTSEPSPPSNKNKLSSELHELPPVSLRLYNSEAIHKKSDRPLHTYMPQKKLGGNSKSEGASAPKQNPPQSEGEDATNLPEKRDDRAVALVEVRWRERQIVDQRRVERARRIHERKQQRELEELARVNRAREITRQEELLERLEALEYAKKGRQRHEERRAHNVQYLKNVDLEVLAGTRSILDVMKIRKQEMDMAERAREKAILEERRARYQSERLAELKVKRASEGRSDQLITY